MQKINCFHKTQSMFKFKKKDRYVSTIVGSLEEGSGNSISTTLFASTLASDLAMQSLGFEKGFKVLVIDVGSQPSLFEQRQKDIKSSDFYKKDIYDVICVRGQDLEPVIRQKEIELSSTKGKKKYYSVDWQADNEANNQNSALTEQLLYHYEGGSLFKNYDFVFFDLPSAILKDTNLKRSYILSDNIIIPVRPSEYDISSLIPFFKFINAIINHREKADYETNVLTFVNQVKTDYMSRALPQILKQITESNGFKYCPQELGHRTKFGLINTSQTFFDLNSLEKFKEIREYEKKWDRRVRKRFRQFEQYEFTLLFLSLCPYFFDV